MRLVPAYDHPPSRRQRCTTSSGTGTMNQGYATNRDNESVRMPRRRTGLPHESNSRGKPPILSWAESLRRHGRAFCLASVIHSPGSPPGYGLHIDNVESRPFAAMMPSFGSGHFGIRSAGLSPAASRSPDRTATPESPSRGASCRGCPSPPRCLPRRVPASPSPAQATSRL